MSSMPKLFADGRFHDALLVIFLGILQAAAMGFAAFATRDIFSALYRNTATLPYASIALLAVAGISVAAIYVLIRVRAEALGQSYARSLRYVLYRHIAGMTQQDLSKKRLGALSLRFVGDLSAVRGWVGLGITRLAAGVAIVPSALFALYLLNPMLALAGGVPVLISLLLAFALAGGLRGRHASLRSSRSNLAISMIERIDRAAELDLAGRTELELAKLDGDGAVLRDEAVKRVTRVSMLRALPQIGAAVGGVAILWVALLTGIAGSNVAGALAVLGIVILPLRDLTSVWDRYCSWSIARDKCETLFGVQSHLRRVHSCGTPVPVHFSQVRFRGMDINLLIPAGAAVFVTGAPGCGKSSLLSLAAAQNRSDSGRISYGMSRGSLPRISYIGETGLILQGSLRRSLGLGIKPRPKQRVLLRAARDFGLDPIIERIGGLRGRIHERGRTMSASEALRLALARAVLSDPDLIVIDNAQFDLEPERDTLLQLIRRKTNATILLAMARPGGIPGYDRLEIGAGEMVFVAAEKLTETQAEAA